MLEAIFFCLPSAVYVIVQMRRQGAPFHQELDHVGARWGRAAAYGWALLVLIPLVPAVWLSLLGVPAALFDLPGVTIARIVSAPGAITAFLSAGGEEVFFRGLLGGILIRRLGFGWGNLGQAVVFLVPHLALLFVDARLWPILPVQLVIGWVLGWLRSLAGSFVPGIFVHGLTNLAAGIVAL